MNQEYIDSHGGIEVAQKDQVKNSRSTLFHFCGKKPIVSSVNFSTFSPAPCCNTAEVTNILCKGKKGFFTTLSAWNSPNCSSQRKKKHSKFFTKNRFFVSILGHTTMGTVKLCALLTSWSSRQC